MRFMLHYIGIPAYLGCVEIDDLPDGWYSMTNYIEDQWDEFLLTSEAPELNFVSWLQDNSPHIRDVRNPFDENEESPMHIYLDTK